MLPVLRNLFSSTYRDSIATSGDPESVTSGFEQILQDISVSMAPNCESEQDVIDRALRKLACDLHSDGGQEVIEEVRREIAYRQWCAGAKI